MAGSAAIAITATGGMVGIGTLSGAASFSIEATGTAGDDADLAGSATIAVAATGSLSGIARSSGVATFSIGAVGAASGGEEPTTTNPWGISWGNSWGDSWGAFTTPFQKLDFSKQLFVRSVLNIFYAKSVVEQIVTYASTENISVMEAIRVVTVSTKQTSLTVTRRAKRSVQQEPQVAAPKIRQSTPEKNLAVFSVVPSAVAFTAPDEITITKTTQAVVLKTQQPSATIKRKQVS